MRIVVIVLFTLTLGTLGVSAQAHQGALRAIAAMTA